MDEELIRRIVKEEILNNISFESYTSSEYVGDKGDGSMYRDCTTVIVHYGEQEIARFDTNN